MTPHTDESDTDPRQLADAVRQLVENGETDAALELVGRAWRVWSSSGALDLGLTAAAAALDAPGSPGAGVWRARALYADGLLAFRAGDNVRSRARNEELLSLARGTGDVRGECDALTGLARLALRERNYSDAVAHARKARERARTASDVEAEAAPLHLEAAGVRLQQQYADARVLYETSLDLNERLGKHAIVAMELHNLGWVELHLGNVAGAEARFRERDRTSAADAHGDAWSELNWAGVAVQRGQVDEARQRFDIGVHALEKLHMMLDPDDEAELEWLKGMLASPRC